MNADDQLLERMRRLLGGKPGMREKKMFGGVTFFHRGNMCCGVAKGELVLRVGPEAAAKAVEEPHVRLCDFTGRPMKGWVQVAPQRLAIRDDLADWLDLALAFAAGLPPKPGY